MIQRGCIHGALFTIRTVAVGGALACAAGCMNVAVYRTARTLPEGEGDFSMTWSYVRATVAERANMDGQELPEVTFGFPNVVPEVAYHHGLSEHLELGGRVSPAVGLGEIDVKYRFLGGNGPGLHLAVQPAIGYRGVGFINGVNTSLPVIATYDVSDSVSLNAALFGMYTSYDFTAEDARDNLDFGGDSWIGGVSAGVQVRSTSGFHFMPSVEVQQTLSRSGDVEDLPDISSLIVAITMGWGPGSPVQ